MDLKDLPEFNPVETANVGSKVICNPIPEKSDTDYLFLVSDLSRDTKYLLESGWRTGGSKDVMSTSSWASLKKYNRKFKIYENFILTDDPMIFDSFVRATKLCKKLNLLKKEDRVTVHEALIYNHWPTEYGIIDE